MKRVLHVIECLSLGGASRSLIALISALKSISDTEHKILSLRDTQEGATRLAEDAQISILVSADEKEWRNEVAKVDLVQLHFWNTPIIYSFLETELPPSRRLIWAHINGECNPHRIPAEVLNWCDYFVSSTPKTLELEEVSSAVSAGNCSATNITEACDFARLECTRHEKEVYRVQNSFNIGYIGTVNRVKMHPDYVALSSGVSIPNAHFPVFGSGDGFRSLAAEAAAIGQSERFSFRGYATNVAETFASFDIFGYPLRADNYSTSELVVQESLYCGVPAVVFAHGGAGELIRHEETGLVATTLRDYQESLQRLHCDSAMRQTLQRNARRFALDNLGAGRTASDFQVLYQELLKLPKRTGSTLSKLAGAQSFVRSLGLHANEFAMSLAAHVRGIPSSVDDVIANSSELVASADSGGVLHYRSAYPHDPLLRFWSGLILQQQGRPALAALEFRRATELGLSSSEMSSQLDTFSKVSNRVANNE